MNLCPSELVILHFTESIVIAMPLILGLTTDCGFIAKLQNDTVTANGDGDCSLSFGLSMK